MEIKLNRILIITIFTTFFFGCAKLPLPHITYDIYKHNKTEGVPVNAFFGDPSVIEVFQPQETVLFSCIDGQDLSHSDGYGNTNYIYPSSILVTPGIHGLVVKYSSRSGYTNSHLWFEAIEGKQYKLNRKLNGYSVQIWMEDAETGKPVGGIPGSEPIQNPPLMYCSKRAVNNNDDTNEDENWD